MSAPANVRLVDFVFMVGLDPDSSLVEKNVPGAEKENKNGTGSDEEPKEKQLKIRHQKTLSQPITLREKQESSHQLDNCDLERTKNDHPVQRTYQPEILQRYPQEDYQDGTKFPRYLSMFCFPDDLRMAYDEDAHEPPQATYHSFIVTEEDGGKTYGTCLTIWERLSGNLSQEMSGRIERWKSMNLTQNDLEYILHIKSQLSQQEDVISRSKRNSLCPGELPLEVTPNLADAEEKATLYRELLKPLKSTLQIDISNIWAPKSFGVLSRWPFHNFFKDWLCGVARLSCGQDAELPLERYITNLIHEVPLPPPGKLEVSLRIGYKELFLSRPPVNAIPIIQDFSLYPLFRCLSPSNIVILFELALNESKILFVSSYTSMLTLATESLCLLLYPFYWQYVLIPVLPARLTDYLQAPLPFIIGVTRDTFGKVQRQESEDGPILEDVCVVDLDSDTIQGRPKYRLPSKDRKKLLQRLNRYGNGADDTYAALYQTTAHSSPSSRPSKLGRRAPSVAVRGPPLCVKHAYPEGKDIVLGTSKFDEWKMTISEGLDKSGSFIFTPTTASESPHSAAPKSSPSFSSLSPRKGAFLDDDTGISSLPPLSAVSNQREGAAYSNDVGIIGLGLPLPETTGARYSIECENFNDQAILSNRGPADAAEQDGLNREEDDDELPPPVPPKTSETLPSSFVQPTYKSDQILCVHALPDGKDQRKDWAQAAQKSALRLRIPYRPSTRSENERNGHHDPDHKRWSLATSISSTSISDLFKKGSNGRLLTRSRVSTDVETLGSNPSIHGSAGSDAPAPPIPIRRKEGHEFREVSLSMEHIDSGVVSSQSHLRDLSIKSVTEENQDITISWQSKNCAVCREPLTSSLNVKALRCQGCGLVVHGACFYVTDHRPCPVVFHEDKIQSSFLKVFTSLLKHYRAHLVPASSNSNSVDENETMAEEWFDKDGFLGELDREERHFMDFLLGTQACQHFLMDRFERPDTEFEVLFFDECIKAKLNRSIMKLSKEEIPFLKDTSFFITEKHVALSPDCENIPDNYTPPPVLPTELNTSLMNKPREVEHLATPQVTIQLKSQAHELVQRLRRENQLKRKQDLNAWFKAKMKYFSKLNDGEMVSFGLFTEEERQNLFASRWKEVMSVLDGYDKSEAEIRELSVSQIRAALSVLYDQNIILMKTADEEQLVDTSDQQDFKTLYSKLFNAITKYEDRIHHLEAIAKDTPETEFDQLTVNNADETSNLAFAEEVLSLVEAKQQRYQQHVEPDVSDNKPS